MLIGWVTQQRKATEYLNNNNNIKLSGCDRTLALLQTHAYTHTPMQFTDRRMAARADGQAKRTSTRHTTHERRESGEKQSNKMPALLLFRVLCLLLVFLLSFAVSACAHANELRQSEMDIKVFPEARLFAKYFRNTCRTAGAARKERACRERESGAKESGDFLTSPKYLHLLRRRCRCRRRTHHLVSFSAESV